jgi:hypothetical protein
VPGDTKGECLGVRGTATAKQLAFQSGVPARVVRRYEPGAGWVSVADKSK